MLDYYNLIMGTNDSCFVTTFNKLWKKEIISQNLPYTNAIQIENGNRSGSKRGADSHNHEKRN